MPRHFGILVPSTNTTCEIEFCRLAPDLQVHTARLGKAGKTPFSPSLDADVAYQAKLLGDARVEVARLHVVAVEQVVVHGMEALVAGLRLTQDEVFDVRPYAQRVAYAFLRKDLTSNLPRKFKIAFDGCKHGCVAGAINDIGLQAVVRKENGGEKRGFRMVVGGGLGPLPSEAQLLDEFVPVENLVSRCEAVIRTFSKYGNRKNKNKARLKFVLRERGWDWVREQIEKEYADILENGGIATPEQVPQGFGGFESNPQPLGQGALLPVVSKNGSGDAEYDRWLETNIIEQKQTGYAAIIARVEQGNLTSHRLRGLARISRDAGDGLVGVRGHVRAAAHLHQAQVDRRPRGGHRRGCSSGNRRAKLSSCEPAAPLGKRASEMAIMPFRTRV